MVGTRAARWAAAALLTIPLAIPARAGPRLYAPDSLVIPMDTVYQNYGMLEAYGLIYRLLSSGVPVDWVISPGKSYGGVDFQATAVDVQSGIPIANHGYRGGPFVVGSGNLAAALPIVQAWQIAHPQVAVHRTTVPFSANAARELLHAPTMSIFADGNEDIAFKYLNAAAIPMSNGNPWPTKKDGSGLYACPGTLCCPDCLGEAATAGATSTSHADGALFDSNGIPRYCQFMSMHYGAPAQVPEVVAEVREFLRYPVHFFAECQAVNAFENATGGGGSSRETASRRPGLPRRSPTTTATTRSRRPTAPSPTPAAASPPTLSKPAAATTPRTPS